MRTPFTCIERGIWDHPQFGSLSRIGKLVFLYVTTSSYGNGIGCFKAGIAAMAEDMREDMEDFQKGFREGLAAGCFMYDEDARVVLVPKYIHHNPPNNPNVVKGWGKLFLMIPDCALKGECYSIIEDYCKGLSDAFLKAFHEAFEKPSESLSPCFTKASGIGKGIGRGIGRGIGKGSSPENASSKSKVEVEFDQFWEVYPRRVKRPAALESFKKARKKGMPPIQELVTIVKRQVEKGHFLGDDGKEYVPHPTSWLNQGRWDDEIQGSCSQGQLLSDWVARKERESDTTGDKGLPGMGFGMLPGEILLDGKNG